MNRHVPPAAGMEAARGRKRDPARALRREGGSAGGRERDGWDGVSKSVLMQRTEQLYLVLEPAVVALRLFVGIVGLFCLYIGSLLTLDNSFYCYTVC